MNVVVACDSAPRGLAVASNGTVFFTVGNEDEGEGIASMVPGIYSKRENGDEVECVLEFQEIDLNPGLGPNFQAVLAVYTDGSSLIVATSFGHVWKVGCINGKPRYIQHIADFGPGAMAASVLVCRDGSVVVSHMQNTGTFIRRISLNDDTWTPEILAGRDKRENEAFQSGLIGAENAYFAGDCFVAECRDNSILVGCAYCVYRIRDRLVTPVAGSGAADSKDGENNEAGFDRILSIAVDADGNAVVGEEDLTLGKIRKLTFSDAGCTVTTIALGKEQLGGPSVVICPTGKLLLLYSFFRLADLKYAIFESNEKLFAGGISHVPRKQLVLTTRGFRNTPPTARSAVQTVLLVVNRARTINTEGWLNTLPELPRELWYTIILSNMMHHTGRLAGEQVRSIPWYTLEEKDD
jgi:hypothetical protein